MQYAIKCAKAVYDRYKVRPYFKEDTFLNLVYINIY